MVLSGGCLCGAVRYELDASQATGGLCHCRMCQKATGAPVVGMKLVPIEMVRFTSAAPKAYRSSEITERGFCPECGTSIYHRSLVNDVITIYCATLDDPNQLPMDGHYGVESKVDWINIDDGLPRYEYVEDYIERVKDKCEWREAIRKIDTN